ncbi:MAG: RlmE family RNA methyltransferase [Methanomassiliicoccales archaeon]|nr:RlmE family RNA methyltransferase [Methanomassiliicoccales archaeon]NYT15749.1 RlmE family RNA methyltransferase [Methanomassiliicoccales archaeon]
MTKRWLQTRRSDYYYKKAKQMDYRSRAAFKLKQIDNKFHLLREGYRVVDLGAAPGGWLQVAKEAVGPSGKVVGVDLQTIPPIDGVETIRGDLRKEETVGRLLAALEGEADVVLSDMSPNISGHYSTDHARSVGLVETALSIAKVTLRPGGSFLAKVFEGDMIRDLRRVVESCFKEVKLHSPKASRSSSSEIYIIARGFQPEKLILDDEIPTQG